MKETEGFSVHQLDPKQSQANFCFVKTTDPFLSSRCFPQVLQSMTWRTCLPFFPSNQYVCILVLAPRGHFGVRPRESHCTMCCINTEQRHSSRPQNPLICLLITTEGWLQPVLNFSCIFPHLVINNKGEGTAVFSSVCADGEILHTRAPKVYTLIPGTHSHGK